MIVAKTGLVIEVDMIDLSMSLSMSESESSSRKSDGDKISDGSDKDLGKLGDNDRASPADEGVNAVVAEG